MSPDRPIFVLGPPRSGTSLLYKTLCRHPDVTWLSRGYKKFPQWPALAELLTRMGVVSDSPKESRIIWNRFHTSRFDVTGPEDVTPEIREWYRTLIGRLVELRGRKRFLAKFPAHSMRAPWINAVFPDAVFLVATRDWRAVVNSTVVKRANDTKDRERWWGVRVPGWGKMKATMAPEESAARVFRIVHETLESQEASFPGRFFRVKYEDVCRDTVGEMRRVTDACGLEWSDEFEASLPTGLRSSNYKWRENISDELVDKIRAAEGELLSRYEEPDAEPPA